MWGGGAYAAASGQVHARAVAHVRARSRPLPQHCARPSVEDGAIELVGLRSIVHVVRRARHRWLRSAAANARGLRQGAVIACSACVRGVRLAQVSWFRVRFTSPVYMQVRAAQRGLARRPHAPPALTRCTQVDGEPWLQSPGEVEVAHHGHAAVLHAP